MKDTQHQRQFICYSIPVSGFHNCMCSFSQSDLVTLGLLAVNFCLGGGGAGPGCCKYSSAYRFFYYSCTSLPPNLSLNFILFSLKGTLKNFCL